jgi:alanyl-tRNA synthetase
MTEQLYFDDPLRLEFEAEIIDSFDLPDGRTGVVMPGTYFYPTSGGQDHDTGTIGEARVLDVYKEDGRIVHSLSLALPIGIYPARIDRQRRLRNMQHHTGQHVLTGAFVSVLGLETVSAHISGETPSSIDLDADALTPEDLARVEDFANAILFENRKVKSYYVTDAEADKIPFRKAPAVSGRIRVIEVDGFDYSACGGTHCPQTGMVGLLKIVKTERVNQKLRVYFVAGSQALEFLRDMQSVTQGAAAQLGVNPDGVLDELARLQDQAKAMQSELDDLRGLALEVEAEKLAEQAKSVGSLKLVTAIFRDRPPAELRSLGMKLRNQPGLVSLLAGYDGQKLSLVVACAGDAGLNACDLLNRHLAPLNGRGGGDAGLAQGGGVADEAALDGLFGETEKYLSS